MFHVTRLAACAVVAAAAASLSAAPVPAATSGAGPTAAGSAAAGSGAVIQPHLAFDESDHPRLPGVRRGARVTPLLHPADHFRDYPSSPGEGAMSTEQAGAPEVLGFAQEGEVLSGDWQADIHLDLISTLAYDSIDVDSADCGSGIPGGVGDTNCLVSDEGYQVYQSSQATSLFDDAHAAGDVVVVTFTDFSTGDINTLLTSSADETAFIAAVVSQVTTRGVDGVNIDFEPVGDTADAGAFTSLMGRLQSALNADAPGSSYLSVDTYASAYQGGEMYDIPSLAQAVDAIDVMTYSMNGPTQPNSPMGGPYAYTDPSVVDGYLSEMPADKLLLGIPYFGEVYSTTSDVFNAPVADPSQTLSPTYSSILADFACVAQPDGTPGPVINWDSTSETPWAYWWGPTSNASCGSDYTTWRELYYDNAQSLEAKYALVYADHLRGIGIWALGMDSGSDDLWNAIADSFFPLSAPPSAVSAVSTASGSATVSWTPPADAAADHVSGYSVAAYNDLGQQQGSAQPVSGASSSSTRVTGLADGTPWYFTVASVNPSGTGTPAESNSVTPLSGDEPPARTSATSTEQYFLPNSDGSQWQVMDESNLSLEITPTTTEDVLLSVGASLWTMAAGYNQDLGLAVTPAGGASVLVGWKEAGGSGGTFSPNAAFLEAAYSMSAGVSYTVQVVWKSNRPAIGATIAAGAGPLGSAYSPVQLTADALPSGGTSLVSTQQYALGGSDGSTWNDLDPSRLSTSFSPAQNEEAVISGNADLFTGTAGYNPDLAITVSENGGPQQLLAWAEAGGMAGTFSPSAAYVQTVYPVTVGNSYVFSLEWKTNRPAPGVTIYAGAGPLDGAYSPTRLTVYPLASTWPSTASNLQYHLANSDGSTWQEMDPANLAETLTPGSAEKVLVSGNTSLFTTGAGYNQDLAIFVSVNGGTPQLLGWEESGGSSALSPTATMVEVAYSVEPGSSYVFSLWWKANLPASGTTIMAGAGPLNGAHSPTRLTVVPQS